MTSVDEESDLFDATDTVSLTVELPRALVERLNALATRADGGLPGLMTNLLTDHLPFLEQKFEAIEEALADLDAGGPTYSNEEVMAWLESWETPDELPPPGSG